MLKKVTKYAKWYCHEICFPIFTFLSISNMVSISRQYSIESSTFWPRNLIFFSLIIQNRNMYISWFGSFFFCFLFPLSHNLVTLHTHTHNDIYLFNIYFCNIIPILYTQFIILKKAIPFSLFNYKFMNELEA